MADIFIDQDEYPKFKVLSKDFLKSLTAGELAHLFEAFTIYKYRKATMLNRYFSEVSGEISVSDLRVYLNDTPNVWFLIILEKEADESALKGGLK